MFLIGVIGFALASVAIGLVGSISGVIAFRVLQGAFGAILMPNTLALLRSAYSEDELTRAVGTWSSAAGAATAAGPILGGLLVDNVSWESVFYLNVPVAIATLALGIPYLLESRESHRDPIDWPGVLTLAGGLSALIYGLVKGQEWGWVAGRTLGILGAAVVLLVGVRLRRVTGVGAAASAVAVQGSLGLDGLAHRAAELLRALRRALLRLAVPAERLGLLGAQRGPAHAAADGRLLAQQPARRADHHPLRTAGAHRRRAALGRRSRCSC